MAWPESRADRNASENDLQIQRLAASRSWGYGLTIAFSKALP
jgi:hypothetical protein